MIEMGGEPVFIAEENRPLYHAALAFAANHLVTLVAEAASLLGQAGADNPERMLGPLLGAALDNALRFGDAGLTGPVARGDSGTVAAHLAAIRAAEPGALPAYLALARLTADRALAAAVSARATPSAYSTCLETADDRRQHPGGAQAARDKLTGPVVLVPTMGALHDGHRALLRRARELAGAGGTVAVSIFVNPLQFGPNEDLDKYPRTLDADLAACEAEGVDLVFAPSVREMYPQEQLVMVDPGPTGEILEGEFRPGFFHGVLTVVLKLFSLVRPDIAVFGQKDAQQLVLVRRMSADFGLGIEIEAVPTVRAADGLALSSRNKYLSRAERAVAPVLHRALAAGAAARLRGPARSSPPRRRCSTARACDTGRDARGPPRVDYLALVDAREATGPFG